MSKINLHLISDSTGETLGAISRAVMSQFKNVEVQEYMWSLVRTKQKIEEAVKLIKEKPGIVLYTILDQELLDYLIDECDSEKIVAISALGEIINVFSNYLGKETIKTPGRQHLLDKEYFKKIEAINFTINHDDGKKVDDLDEAEIILVGPSRTSKSPTCAYLSQRGIKAANVPFISGIEMPKILGELKKPLIVGLTINPEILIQIRKNRITMFNQNITEENKYVALDEVKGELLEARKFYSRNRWAVIDVTRRSIEETSATIIQKFNNHVRNS